MHDLAGHQCVRVPPTYIRNMKAKLTLSVDRGLLAKARRKLQQRNRSISAEVDALLERIAGEDTPERKPWSELFGDLCIAVPAGSHDMDDWYAKHLRPSTVGGKPGAGTKAKPRR